MRKLVRFGNNRQIRVFPYIVLSVHRICSVALILALKILTENKNMHV